MNKAVLAADVRNCRKHWRPGQIYFSAPRDDNDSDCYCYNNISFIINNIILLSLLIIIIVIININIIIIHFMLYSQNSYLAVLAKRMMRLIG